ncbi:MAG: EAL domain-containing protein [Hyphomicrobiaceae bacterium]|jgi:cyclic-di-GMP phosphodiesterase, flagellum assembly factor TipF|nr:EAL domain-containing protein [Hyphomicrobiaceae bacterium]
MKRTAAPSRQNAEARPKTGGRAVDVFVVIAMGVVMLALATALNLQFGVDINVAVAISTVIYAGLLAIHAMKRRTAARPPARRSRTAPAFEAFGDIHDRLAAHTPPPMPDRALSQLEVPPSMRPRAKVAQVSLPPLGEHGAAPPRHAPSGHAVSAGHSGSHAGPQGPVSGTVRPGLPRAFQPAPVAELSATGAPRQRAAPPNDEANSLESDVERIQALVKKLANEINAADEAAEDVNYPLSRPPRLPADAALDASVGALRQAMDGMKAPASPSSLTQSRAGSALQGSARSAPPPLSPAQQHVAAVADSLVAGRVEVELEPILSLVDQRTSHYEVSVNVHGKGGDRIVENDGFAGLQGTGLLPLFDSARLSRSVSIAQRLQEKGKKGRIFSAYSPESLTNPSFLSDARAALQERGNIGTQLVIGFQQAHMRAFTSSEWAAIAELRHLHVVFAIDRLTHLDFDLKQLVANGFAFIRIESNQFLAGLRFGGRPVGGSELVRYITGAGMSLVVDNINSEQQLQRLAEVGVQLGQGRVFGGRRAVKLSGAKSSNAAA